MLKLPRAFLTACPPRLRSGRRAARRAPLRRLVPLCLLVLVLLASSCEELEKVIREANIPGETADASPPPPPPPPTTCPPAVNSVNSESGTHPDASPDAPADPNAPLCEIPVITLAYLPIDDEERLKREIVGSDLPDDMLGVDIVRQKIQTQEAEYIELIKESSRFRGYKDAEAPSSIGYVVLERLEYTEEIPVLPSKNYLTDKNLYLSRINVCDYVDNQGVREVWVYMYHNDGVAAPTESDMAMGYSIKGSWPYSDYGDISNSYRQNNMPICQNTYTVYEFNYGRGTDTMQHNLGHQIEAIMTYMDRVLFWAGFAGYSQDNLGGYGYGKSGEKPSRCGSVHWTPNSTVEYVSWETDDPEVYSDCANWNPDDPGERELVGCRTWFEGECTPGDSIPWQTWWMQNLPGINNGLSYNGRELRNWWEFIGDFDSAITLGKSLTK